MCITVSKTFKEVVIPVELLKTIFKFISVRRIQKKCLMHINTKFTSSTAISVCLRDIWCIFIVCFFLWQSGRSSPVFSPFFMTSLQLLWVLSVPLEFPVPFLYLFVFGLDLFFLNQFKLAYFWGFFMVRWGGGIWPPVGHRLSAPKAAFDWIWKCRCCCFAAPYTCGGPHAILWFQLDEWEQQ